MKRSIVILAINDLDFGGGQKTVIAEANELHLRGVPVHVLVTLKNPRMHLQPLLRIPDSQLHHVSFGSFFDMRGYRKLFSLFKTLQPRAVVSNLFFTNTVVRLTLLFFPGVSVVVREGNIVFQKSVFSKLLDAALSLRTRAVIGNSKTVVDSITTLALFTKKSVLMNGIDDAFFRIERGSTRPTLAIPPQTLAVLIVAALTKKKGHRYAFDALARMPDKGKDIALFVVGEGSERASLTAYAHQLGITERVFFLGGKTDISALLSAVDVFLLPSLWEGMPNALLEAMAAGLPVISTNVGGVSEIVKNGETGYLVPKEDARAISVALQAMKDNPALRTNLGDAARAAVSHLTWERHVTRLLEIV